MKKCDRDIRLNSVLRRNDTKGRSRVNTLFRNSEAKKNYNTIFFLEKVYIFPLLLFSFHFEIHMPF